MPSPFPGMDPYLEGSEWSSVHLELSSEIARQLSAKLRPKYIVRANRRFVTETWDDIAITTGNIYPDVSLFDSTWSGNMPELMLTDSKGFQNLGLELATIAAPLQMTTLIPERVAQVTLEIRDVAQRALVTAIEILSPTNKYGEGYQEYLNKRQRILHTPTHLIELDFLRRGKRVPMQQPLPATPYFVFLSRSERRPRVEVWPIQLNMHLPTIPVPLLSPDHDVTLDLQLAFETIYDALNYDLSIDYTRAPEVPLTGEAAIWAKQWLSQVRKTS